MKLLATTFTLFALAAALFLSGCAITNEQAAAIGSDLSGLGQQLKSQPQTPQVQTENCMIQDVGNGVYRKTCF